MSSPNEIKVAFVDLNNVIILDSHSKRLNQQKHTHARIDCDGCFAYVQEDICTHQSSDINLFAVCQVSSWQYIDLLGIFVELGRATNVSNNPFFVVTLRKPEWRQRKRVSSQLGN